MRKFSSKRFSLALLIIFVSTFVLLPGTIAILKGGHADVILFEGFRFWYFLIATLVISFLLGWRKVGQPNSSVTAESKPQA